MCAREAHHILSSPSQMATTPTLVHQVEQITRNGEYVNVFQVTSAALSTLAAPGT